MKPTAPTSAIDASNVDGLQWLLAALATGAGGGALYGLANKAPQLLGSPEAMVPPDSPTIVRLVGPSAAPPSKSLTWLRPSGVREKPRKTGATAGPFRPAAEAIYGAIKQVGADKMLDLPGLGATTAATSKWWYAPGVLGGLGLGAYGGYRVADWLADKQRAGGLDRELSAAEHEYLQALDSLSAVRAPKQAGLLPQVATNAAGTAASTWLGLATLAGAPSAIMAYNYMRNTADRKAFQEAMAVRRRALQQRQPPAVQFVPHGG